MRFHGEEDNCYWVVSQLTFGEQSFLYKCFRNRKIKSYASGRKYISVQARSSCVQKPGIILKHQRQHSLIKQITNKKMIGYLHGVNMSVTLVKSSQSSCIAYKSVCTMAMLMKLKNKMYAGGPLRITERPLALFCIHSCSILFIS